MFVNDVPTVIDTSAIIVNDRTYVPLRYAAEAFGLEVGYDDG